LKDLSGEVDRFLDCGGWFHRGQKTRDYTRRPAARKDQVDQMRGVGFVRRSEWDLGDIQDGMQCAGSLQQRIRHCSRSVHE
jgi:hypothetical protein